MAKVRQSVDWIGRKKVPRALQLDYVFREKREGKLKFENKGRARYPLCDDSWINLGRNTKNTRNLTHVMTLRASVIKAYI